jgi:6-phosphogluconolactonase/glucosamine-6-phosphate isomerase/deaminase
MISHHQETQKELLLNMAAASFNKLLSNYINVPKLLLFSGGSALDIVNYINTKLIASTNTTTIGVLDESYSSIPSENNFEKLSVTQFFQSLPKNCFGEINTRVKEGETLDTFANRFESEIVNWISQNSTGKIIITQGIGNDAHTSGIMPYPEDESLFKSLFCSEKLVMGYEAGTKNEFPRRATTTISFLRKVDHSIIYMTGPGKNDALHKIYNTNLKLNEVPAKIILEMKDIEIFTDILDFKFE